MVLGYLASCECSVAPASDLTRVFCDCAYLQLKDLFLVQDYNEYGIYGMRFFQDGEWKAVFVDDQLPVKKDKVTFPLSLSKRAPLSPHPSNEIHPSSL